MFGVSRAQQNQQQQQQQNKFKCSELKGKLIEDPQKKKYLSKENAENMDKSNNTFLKSGLFSKNIECCFEKSFMSFKPLRSFLNSCNDAYKFGLRFVLNFTLVVHGFETKTAKKHDVTIRAATRNLTRKF